MLKNILIIIFAILILTSCSNDNRKEAPKAIKGVLDLRNWDFEKDGIIKLDGEWEFYWREFLTSKDFDMVQKKHYIQVPSNWNDNKWEKMPIPYDGYASYKLKILINSKTHRLAFKVPDQGTAFKFFTNDSLFGKNGKIGKTKESTEPQYLPMVIPFENNSDTLELVFWISNFDFHCGGLYFTPQIGIEEDVRKTRESNIRLEYFMSGTLIVFSFILFNFYMFRRKEKASLVFALFSLIFSVRMLTSGEKLITDFYPSINWELLIKLEGLSWMIVLPLVVNYISLLFPSESSKTLVRIANFIGLFLVIIHLFTPAVINSKFILFGQFSAVFYFLWGIYVNIRALFNKREGALIVLFGFLVFFFNALNEMLFYNNIIPLLIPMPFGLLIYFSSQITLLSRKFSKAYLRVENFANELEVTVKERTKELRKEKEISEHERQKSDRLLLNVLPESIATRLKSGETQIADHFDEASVIFIDIADFTKSSAVSTPKLVVEVLNVLYTKLDIIAKNHGLEKIKTIGDCYMAAAGIPLPDPEHALKAAEFALEAMNILKDYDTGKGTILNFRCGIDCGPVVAGVIGENKFIYDVWGDMVNTASRMESNGVVGKIQVTERFKDKISNIEQGISNIEFEERGIIDIKGKGKMRTYFLYESQISTD
jgi:class 3 adenylate cyclase